MSRINLMESMMSAYLSYKERLMRRTKSIKVIWITAATSDEMQSKISDDKMRISERQNKG